MSKDSGKRLLRFSATSKQRGGLIVKELSDICPTLVTGYQRGFDYIGMPTIMEFYESDCCLERKNPDERELRSET